MTKFAPRRALQFIARGTLTLNGRVVLHPVGVVGQPVRQRQRTVYCRLRRENSVAMVGGEGRVFFPALSHLKERQCVPVTLARFLDPEAAPAWGRRYQWLLSAGRQIESENKDYD